MARWTFGLGRKPPHVSRETKDLLQAKSLTAAASTVRGADTSFLPNSESWQNEVWSYYDTLGEFRYAVDWKSRMMSRVRLFAARIEPGQDEPVRIEDDSLAVQLMSRLGGALGQASLLADLSTQLDIPGEGFVIAETINGQELWSIRSIDEIRKRSGRFEIVSEEALPSAQDWRPLAPDHFVMRVFQPHKRYHNVADSSARSARNTMRELELVNRHIISQYLSRLASAGMLLLPQEVHFPVREEFADQPNPLMAELIELASTAIREPGTAAAVIPLLMEMPGEWLDKVQHLDFTMQIDERIIEKRESAVRRLATQVNIPAEVLTGMGDVNHWGAWQLEEGALKTTIAPDAETICAAFTTQYLQPRLAASGEEDPDQFVIWYDMSELTIRPDRSGNAFQAYDRLEISGAALRRETGFDEADKPEDDELREQGLKVIINTLPSGAASALAQLVGDESVQPVIPVSAQPPEVAEEATQTPAEERTEPPTQEEPPPAPDMAAVRTQRLISQARAAHAIRFAPGDRWELLHPMICEQHAYTCPYTHAALGLSTRPGRRGLYECMLDAFGRLRIGDLSQQIDPSEFLITKGGGMNGNRK